MSEAVLNLARDQRGILLRAVATEHGLTGPRISNTSIFKQ